MCGRVGWGNYLRFWLDKDFYVHRWLFIVWEFDDIMHTCTCLHMSGTSCMYIHVHCTGYPVRLVMHTTPSHFISPTCYTISDMVCSHGTMAACNELWCHAHWQWHYHSMCSLLMIHAISPHNKQTDFTLNLVQSNWKLANNWLHLYITRTPTHPHTLTPHTPSHPHTTHTLTLLSLLVTRSMASSVRYFL